MLQQKPQYVNNSCVMVVNPLGRVSELYVPFRVKCIEPVGSFHENFHLYVDEVRQDSSYVLLYRIYGSYYPFSFFHIPAYT